MNRNQKYFFVADVIATAATVAAGAARGWDLIQITLPLCLAISMVAGAGWVRQYHKWSYSKHQKSVVVWALILSPAVGLLLLQRAGLLGFVGGTAAIGIWAFRGWLSDYEGKPHRGNGYAGSGKDAT